MTLELDIKGDPAPQGSKKIIKGRLIEASSEKLKRWRKAIAAECVEKQKTHNTFYTGPVRVEVVFFLPRPKTITKDKREYPIVPPDLDKLCRGLLDGIGQSQIVWGDDSQVVELMASKVYAENPDNAGAKVLITVL